MRDVNAILGCVAAAARKAGAAAALAAFAAVPAVAETRLVLVEQAGCAWCARWDREIAPVYPLTEEGRRAPLRRVELRALPAEIDFAGRPRLTPTFVLVRDGAELGRIEGYAGDDFFWPMVTRLLDEAGVPPAPHAAPPPAPTGADG